MCETKSRIHTHIDLQSDGTDSKSVELRFMSVRVGLGVPFSQKLSFKKVSFVSLLILCIKKYFYLNYLHKLLLKKVGMIEEKIKICIFDKALQLYQKVILKNLYLMLREVLKKSSDRN